MLREIKIYGRLAKFLGQRIFKADVSNAAEAIRFLLANFPQLEPELSKGHYKVCAGSYVLGQEELHDPSGSQAIKIIPVIAGAGGGSGAALKIIAGVALVALSFVSFGATGAFAGIASASAAATGAVGSSFLFSIGATLILGGVAQLLTPIPSTPVTAEEKDPKKSYSFSGIQNTSRQGTPLPMVYGETLTGSIIVSAGIDTVQVET